MPNVVSRLVPPPCQVADCRCRGLVCDPGETTCGCTHAGADHFHPVAQTLAPRTCDNGNMFQPVDARLVATGRSPCICGEFYYNHAPLNSEPSPTPHPTPTPAPRPTPAPAPHPTATPVPTPTGPSLPAWARPAPAGGSSANDRRRAPHYPERRAQAQAQVESISRPDRQSHGPAAGVTPSPIVFPFEQENQQGGPQRQTQAARNRRADDRRAGPRSQTRSSPRMRDGENNTQVIVLLHPEPPYDHVYTEGNGAFQTLRCPKPGRIDFAIQQFERLHLAFSFPVAGRGDDLVVDQFDAAIHRHMMAHGLYFSSSTSNPADPTRRPWTFWTTGQIARNAALGALLKPIADRGDRTELMTVRGLKKTSGRYPKLAQPRHKHCIVFVGPEEYTIRGPLPTEDGIHGCLGDRVWDGVHSASTDTTCLSSCVTSTRADNSSNNVTTTTPSASASTVSASSGSSGSTASSVSQSSDNTSTTFDCSNVDSDMQDVVRSPLSDSALSSQDALAHARARLGDARSRILPTSLVVRAPNAKDGARALLSALMSLVGIERAMIPSFPDDCDVLNLTWETLTADSCHFDIGAGVGDGPRRAVMNALVDFVVCNPSYWIALRDDGVGDDIFTPVLPVLTPSHHDVLMFEVFGVIIAVLMLWDLDWLPISPAVITLLLSDFQTATQQTLISAVAPAVARRIASWPPPTVTLPNQQGALNIVPGQDPFNILIEIDSNLQIGMLQRLSIEGQRDLGLRIASQAVFRSQIPLAIPNHPLLQGMLAGLRRVVDIPQLLGPHPHLVIQEMGMRRELESADELIALIDVMPISPDLASLRGYNPDLDYFELAHQFTEKLFRYLRGRGHPMPQAFAEDMDPSEYGDVHHPAFRSRRFLKVVTERRYKPLSSEPFIKIKFVPAMAGHNAVNMQAHTCFSTVDVLLDSNVAVVLRDATPDDVQTCTEFDFLTHFFTMQDSGYNTA